MSIVSCMGARDELGLPTEQRQRWLHQQLLILVKASGPEPLLHSRLLEPTPTFFPEGWVPDLEAAAVISRRLLDFARLDALELEMVAFVNEAPSDVDDDWERRHVVGFFQGIEDSVCRFGIHVPALEDPEYLTGIMAHEVAHAFRHHHGLVHDDRDIEEELTDLTTVYLGSGILTANLADRVVVDRVPTHVRLQRSTGGYLAVEDFGYLLALQLRARGADSGEVARVSAFLGSSQVYCLNHALERLDELGVSELSLRQGLALSDAVVRAQLPAPRPVVVEDPKRYSRPWGRLVYRARRSRTKQGLALGVVLGFVLSMLMLRSFREVAPLMLAVCPLLGVLWGKLASRQYCSNAACQTRMFGDEPECPGCKGHVLGTLREPPITFGVGSSLRSKVKRRVGYRTDQYACWGLFYGSLLTTLATPLGLSLGYALWGGLLGAGVGGMLGRRQRRDRCSDRDCQAVLDDFVKVCPRCQGEVHGEAHSDVETL